jgi:hypothetical protein
VRGRLKEQRACDALDDSYLHKGCDTGRAASDTGRLTASADRGDRTASRAELIVIYGEIVGDG